MAALHRSALLVLAGVLMWMSDWAAAQQPVQVKVGSYIQNVTDLDLRAGKATVDAYLWFRWPEDASVSPGETFELVNGDEAARISLDTRVVNGEKLASLRLKAVVHVPWDLQKFSLDQQVISIKIEDGSNDTRELIYVPDDQNSMVRDSIWLPGYRLAGQRVGVTESVYKTNFGDTSLPSDARTVYSQYQHGVVISRPGHTYFLKLFATMFLSTLVVAVAFVLEPANIEGRVAIATGALFAVVATNYVIAGQLPDTDVFSLADQINFLSMGVILASLILIVFSWRQHAKVGENTPLMRLADRIGLLGLPMSYAAIIALLATN